MYVMTAVQCSPTIYSIFVNLTQSVEQYITCVRSEVQTVFKL